MPDLSELYTLIKRFEGCRLKAYLCPAGVWTVGWGSTGVDIGPGTVWSQAEADRRMQIDADRFARQTVALLPNLAHDSGALSAIADFAYNLGIGNLRGSTLRRRVAEEDWEGAARELMRWTRGGGRVLRGLVLRRQAEVELLPE